MIYPPPDYIDRRIERLERQRQADEDLLHRALAALEYSYEQLPLIHAKEIEPTIQRLKDRL
jgi:hypothetical protein